MAEYVKFSEMSKDTGGSIFLRIKSNEPTIHCRLVGKPIKTCKVYHDKTWVNMTVDDANKLYQQHSYIFRFAPRPTYAMLVIDRTDDRVKILEFPTTVFREFSKRFDVTGENPGGKCKGEEWKLRATGTGIKTTYAAVHICVIGLTDAEVDRVNEFRTKQDLPDYYPTSNYNEVVQEFNLSVSTVGSFKI